MQTGDRRIEVRELPLPDRLPEDHALLRVEANGVCGTDYSQFNGGMRGTGWVDYPLVPGHEPVGRLEWVGAEAGALWGLAAGARVALEAFVPCHVCPACTRGREKFCTRRFVYGYVPLAVGSGLWGGFSEYLVVRPNSVVHRLPEHLAPEVAALQNPLAAGFEWMIRQAGTTVGDRVLVLGCGQRGLACVAAAAETGASEIIVTGLARDEHKLALARRLGATRTVVLEDEDVVEVVREVTGGELVDRVVELAPRATQSILDAIDCAAPGGTVVLAATKSGNEVPGFVSDRVVQKALTIKGVLSASAWAHEEAIRLLAKAERPVAEMHTHEFSLSEVEDAILLLGGERGGEAIHVTVSAATSPRREEEKR